MSEYVKDAIDQREVAQRYRFACDGCRHRAPELRTIPVGEYGLAFVCSEPCEVVVLLRYG